MNSTISFIQISDTHIYSKNDEINCGVKPVPILKEAVADINDSFPNASFTIHTGDSTTMASEEDYACYKSIIKELKSPIYHIRGNHDCNAELFRKMFAADRDKDLHVDFKIDNWHFLGLDCNSKDMYSPQVATESELDWLQQSLAENGEYHTILFLHAHINPIQAEELDNVMIKNSEQINRILSTHSCIRCVVFGHVHHPTLHLGQFVSLSAPSLAHQVLPVSQELVFNVGCPGYRVFDLDERGCIYTYVRRLSSPPTNNHPILISANIT